MSDQAAPMPPALPPLPSPPPPTAAAASTDAPVDPAAAAQVDAPELTDEAIDPEPQPEPEQSAADTTGEEETARLSGDFDLESVLREAESAIAEATQAQSSEAAFREQQATVVGQWKHYADELLAENKRLSADNQRIRQERNRVAEALRQLVAINKRSA